MYKKLLTLSFVFAFSVVAFAQHKSVYSEITPENCVGKSNPNVPGSYFGKCKGVSGFDLEYYVSDSRDSLGIVSPSKKVFGLNFYEYFKDFSEVGKKVEWRLQNNKPFALIVRLNVSDQEDETKQTSYLIVSKITEENACVIDVLDPSKNQNVLARKVADKASTKECMPEFISNETIEEDPAINAMIGKDSGEFLAQADIKSRLIKLLGKQDYASFTEYFEVRSPIKRDGDFLYASGCMIRACTRLESAFAYNVKTHTIHAAIFDQIKETKYFNENKSRTPEIISDWAKRLEDLKPVEDQNEAILFDEFEYQNSEDFMARFDAFAIELENDPENKGFVIIYGDKKSYAAKEKEIKEYSARRLGSKKLNYLKGVGDSKTEIQFWIVPKGAKSPTPRKAANQNESIKNEIIALEKQAWESWKNKDIDFFKTLLAEDAISVNSGGVFDKPQILEFYASCEVKSYSLDDFKFRMLDKNSALITFKAKQNANCDGEKNPSNVRVSSVYVKRNGKWQNMLYMETAEVK